MLRVGIAGIGFMGMIHYLNYKKVAGCKVAAICEQNEKRLQGDWTDIKGNFGPPGEQMDLTGVKTYNDLQQMLQDPDIDVIDITLPPNMHADIALAAFAAGKHVFSEKPLTLDAESSRKVVEAAAAADRQLLVGHVLPFFPEYTWARETALSGKYGKLLGGSFRRVISDPTWLTNYWRPELIGGPMLDLHVHDAHFIRYLFGMPKSVQTSGRMRGELAQSWLSVFSFDDPDVVVSANSGTIDQQGRPFWHGFEIQLERATLVFDFAVIGEEGQYLCKPTLLDSDGNVEFPELGDGDPMFAFERELTEVVDCIQNGKPSAILGGELARDAISLCQAQTDSLKQNTAISL